MDMIIKTKKMTKEYSPTTGCFGIDLNIEPGKVFGFIGPNGAGKTTVIRQLIGLIKPDKGEGTILGKDIWSNSKENMRDIGYVPGEPALPTNMKGIKFLKAIANIRGDVDLKYMNKLIDHLNLDSNIKIKKMSKGMKQKVSIVQAFMHKPKILILDEPSSGLDPLMQEKLNKIIEKAQSEGATIFLSSHIFGEISKTCDEVSFIKKGKINSQITMKELKNYKEKVYLFSFADAEQYEKFKEIPYAIVKSNIAKKTIEVSINLDDVQKFKTEIKKYKYEDYKEIPFDLEKHFIGLYGSEQDIGDL